MLGFVRVAGFRRVLQAVVGDPFGIAVGYEHGGRAHSSRACAGKDVELGAIHAVIDGLAHGRVGLRPLAPGFGIRAGHDHGGQAGRVHGGDARVVLEQHLVAGDVGVHPVDLSGHQRADGRGSVVQGHIPHAVDLRFTVPIVLEGLEAIGLVGELIQFERAGADRVGIGVVHRVLDVLPDVLGHDGLAAEDATLLHVCAGERLIEFGTVCVLGREDQFDVSIVDDLGGAGRAVGVEGRGVVDQVEGEGHILGGERLAILPLDTFSGGDGQLGAVFVPLVACGKHRSRILIRGEVVPVQGLVDHAQRGTERCGRERVEVLIERAGRSGEDTDHGSASCRVRPAGAG